ncbi:MAG: DUF4269 domain-containing protein [Cytophagales bacterium]|nr:DUF4269 domain-containing protein [Cytophagales bacterium]
MITNFKDPSYLQMGNNRQQHAYNTLQKLEIFATLAPFDPVLTGTIPIEVDISSSDLDVICEVKDEPAFEKLIMTRYNHHAGFVIRKTKKQGLPTIIINFRQEAYEIEIFGQALPVIEQMAYRHMVKEYETLQQKGPSFKKQVIELKEQGFSTEIAFAQLLGIEGDPYLELLKYAL